MNAERNRDLPKADEVKYTMECTIVCFYLSLHSLFVLGPFTMLYTYHVINIYGKIKVLQETQGTRKYLILSMVSFYLFPSCLVWGEEALWGIAQQVPLD